MSKPSLPQDDPRPDRRAKDLAEQAEPYVWTYDAFEGIAAADGVPKPDHPDLIWLAQVGEVMAEILVNAGAVNRHVKELNSSATSTDELKHLIAAAGKDGIKAALEHLENFVLGDELTHVPVGSVEEYEHLFQTLPLPPVAQVYQRDTEFARMRIAGPNPMVIHRVGELPDHFPVSEQDFTRAMDAHRAAGLIPGQDSLAQALSEGRAFLCDYKALEGAPEGTFPRPPKHLYAPLALFVSTASTRQLLPVAIQ